MVFICKRDARGSFAHKGNPETAFVDEFVDGGLSTFGKTTRANMIDKMSASFLESHLRKAFMRFLAHNLFDPPDPELGTRYTTGNFPSL